MAFCDMTTNVLIKLKVAAWMYSWICASFHPRDHLLSLFPTLTVLAIDCMIMISDRWIDRLVQYHRLLNRCFLSLSLYEIL